MKKQLSSLDIHFLLKELQVLKDSRIDKIYQPEKNIILFSLYKTNKGKKLFRINIGKSLCLVDEKEDEGETLGFGMLLRKHLDGYFLYEINQIQPERIIKLGFKVKDSKKFLYVEMFGKGNAILCDDNNKIINSLEHQEFKSRVIRPKEQYEYPIMKYNLYNLDEKKLTEMLKYSKKDSIVTTLATELGLGGLFSEEICLISNIDKKNSPKNIDEEQTKSIFSSVKKILNKEVDPVLVYENEKLIDFAPFKLKSYQNNEIKEQKSFSKAISVFFSQFKEEKTTEFDKRLAELNRILEEQKNTIEKFRLQETETREKGEMIYHKYKQIKEIMDELHAISEKHSWKDIKKRLKGHKVIKEVNDKDRKIVIEI